MYDEFAKIYDSLMTEVDYDQWADYLFRHLLNGKRDTKKILEFGCGTGSITTRLARKGYAMTGVDLSEEMLTEGWSAPSRTSSARAEPVEIL